MYSGGKINWQTKLSRSLVRIRLPRLQQCCQTPQKGRRLGAFGTHTTAHSFLNIHFCGDLRPPLEPHNSQDYVDL